MWMGRYAAASNPVTGADGWPTAAEKGPWEAFATSSPNAQ